VIEGVRGEEGERRVASGQGRIEFDKGVGSGGLGGWDGLGD